MEYERSLCLLHSDEEEDNEDHLKRISMSFSIDILDSLKKQNRFHSLNQTAASERHSRTPGGGLFRNSLSLTVPNKFYADSHQYSKQFDKSYKKISNEYRKRNVTAYDTYNYRPTIANYESAYHHNDRYSSNPRWQNVIGTYAYPKPFKFHRSQKNYYDPRYEEQEITYKKPHKHHYQRRESYDDDIFGNARRKVMYKKERAPQKNYFDDNLDYYNWDSTRKYRDRSHKSKYPKHNGFGLTAFSDTSRNPHRRKSGRDYEPHNDRNYEYDDSDMEANYQSNYLNRPTLRQYDTSYYNNDQMYNMAAPRKRISVTLLDQSYEIPYNALKRTGKIERKSIYPEQHTLSTEEIPHKRKYPTPLTDRRFDSEEEMEMEPQPEPPKRRESGTDVCWSRCIDNSLPRTYQRSSRNFNTFTRPDHRLERGSCQKCRKSLKEKISGFFKRSKSKSRRGCNSKRRGSQYCLDNSKSLSSFSCIVVQRKTPHCRSTTKRTTKCIPYPTVYRDKSYAQMAVDGESDIVSQPSTCPKVNSKQFETGTSKSYRESSRQCEASQVNVECQNARTHGPKRDVATRTCCRPASMDDLAASRTARRSSCSTTRKDSERKTSCGASQIKYDEKADSCSATSIDKKPQRRKSACTCFLDNDNTDCLRDNCSRSSYSMDGSVRPSASPPKKKSYVALSPNRNASCKQIPGNGETETQMEFGKRRSVSQMKQSTINVCLKISTADGNLVEPPQVIATVEPNQDQLDYNRSSTTLESRLKPNASENNFANVRSSRRHSVQPKPIISTAKKSISQYNVKEKASCLDTRRDEREIRRSISKVEFANTSPSNPKAEFPIPRTEAAEISYPTESPRMSDTLRPSSLMEELKQELMDTLKNEQKLLCQCPPQSAPISLYPCIPPNSTCPCPAFPVATIPCWTPL
ncbi:uncharacterized protein LOC133850893 isoform X1 [Drosophila sulfurigaster albostrigata]|uniref:uncharacterized protein LOC133850893 isoform X1 n=1 Tax=Drosophila sulfurigaster albostrigata TaxID=89887 RepID=UPI002D219698|nr:uncharacterized protein LOC133850893 isoform X1 [Drosophila sulfurigaster albostrigata]